MLYVHLRHHGIVTSMNLLMSLISSTIDPSILPLPAVYTIPGEEQRQKATRFGRQIARLIPGPMPIPSILNVTRGEISIARNMALAFQSIWHIPLPKLRLIGELCDTQAGDNIIPNVGLERHYNLGGSFTSVRDYLHANIFSALDAFKRQQDIEEYKARFLQRVTDFMERGMRYTPAIVEEIPLVNVHADMGPQNVTLSPTKTTDIKAIIDWEFVASTPYASLHRIIEMLFKKSAVNGFGAEYAHVDELRDVFWGAIPDWRTWKTRVFLEWFRFGLFMKAEWRPDGLDGEEKERY